jgi:hypothetical protein
MNTREICQDRRGTMRSKQRTNWWIDTTLFAGFLAAFFLSFTGVSLHQWIGVIGGVLAVYHLMQHIDWVETVSQRVFTMANANVQLKYLIDMVIMAGFILIVGTGVVISSWLSLSLTHYDIWLFVHILVSIVTLLVLVIKLAMHWKWIAQVGHNILVKPTIKVSKLSQTRLVMASSQSMDRRTFLRVMGVAGGASMLALLSATRSLAALQSDATTATSHDSVDSSTSSSSSNPSYSEFGSNFNARNGSCSLQCGKRCSYLGRCRRYTDSDSDKYCDLGECS